jgi:hypothetical protein
MPPIRHGWRLFLRGSRFVHEHEPDSLFVAGVGDVSDTQIKHNTIDGSAMPWVYVMDTLGGRRHDWRVRENVVLETLGSPVAMLFFVRVDDVEVRNNVSHAAVEQSRKAVEFQ